LNLTHPFERRAEPHVLSQTQGILDKSAVLLLGDGSTSVWVMHGGWGAGVFPDLGSSLCKKTSRLRSKNEMIGGKVRGIRTFWDQNQQSRDKSRQRPEIVGRPANASRSFAYGEGGGFRSLFSFKPPERGKPSVVNLFRRGDWGRGCGPRGVCLTSFLNSKSQ